MSHAIALEAIHQYPISVRRLRLLHDGYNATYRVDVEDGTRYALRVSRPGPDAATVRAEVAWCDALATDASVRVLHVQKTRHGEPVAVAQGRSCVLSAWVSGAQRGKGLTPRMLEAVGLTMARLHVHAQSWSPPHGWQRPVLDKVWLNAPSPLAGLPESARGVFAEAEQRLEPILKQLIDARCHVMHADLHQGNYRFAKGHDVGVIDFDDCALGHPAQDIAISWYYLQKHPRRDALWQAFRTGYERLLPWPLDAETLEALLIWRALSLCASVEVHPSSRLRALGRSLLPGWTERCRQWLEHSEKGPH